jgi:hypothetical protein
VQSQCTHLRFLCVPVLLQSHALAALAGLLTRANADDRRHNRIRKEKLKATFASELLLCGQYEAVLTAADATVKARPGDGSLVKARADAFADVTAAHQRAKATEAATRSAVLQRQRRVVFVPDCKQLVEAGADYMRKALMLAYADDAGLCQQLAEIAVADPIVTGPQLLSQFLEDRSSEDQLTFIVDQFNELDLPSSTLAAQVDGQSRNEWRTFFAAQGQHHYLVKGASPNATNAVFAHRMDHRDGLAVYWYEGLDKVRRRIGIREELRAGGCSCTSGCMCSSVSVSLTCFLYAFHRGSGQPGSRPGRHVHSTEASLRINANI